VVYLLSPRPACGFVLMQAEAENGRLKELLERFFWRLIDLPIKKPATGRRPEAGIFWYKILALFGIVILSGMVRGWLSHDGPMQDGGDSGTRTTDAARRPTRRRKNGRLVIRVIPLRMGSASVDSPLETKVSRCWARLGHRGGFRTPGEWGGATFEPAVWASIAPTGEADQPNSFPSPSVSPTFFSSARDCSSPTTYPITLHEAA
jgi:hypothetical protein